MSYRVTVLPRAKCQMLDQALWWSENRSAGQALSWLDGLEKALASLGERPDRCVVAREAKAFDFVVRELHYGLRSKATHRVLFEIRDDEVVVHAVRHLAQRDFTPHDV